MEITKCDPIVENEVYQSLIDTIEQWVIGSLRANGMAYERYSDPWIFVERARNAGEPQDRAILLLMLHNIAEDMKKHGPLMKRTVEHTYKLMEMLKAYGYDREFYESNV